MPMHYVINSITANDILAHDRTFGRLCEEAQRSFHAGNYFASLACLFILAESITKFKLEKTHEKFYDLIEEASAKKVFSEDEYIALNELRSIRNKLFHENDYSCFIDINNKVYPLDEDETKKLLYDYYKPLIFGITFTTLQGQITKINN